MIDRVSSKNCCLCKACSNICPTGAIQYTKEQRGFLYPVIDDEKCINCNQCELVCPELAPLNNLGNDCHLAYVARSQQPEVRMCSTSGGIFFESARYILNQGGYVCGAVFENGFHVAHIITNKMEQLKRMCGSKYAQSDTEGVYRDIEQLLKKDKLVLFCGCGCQVAGLRSFLGRNYEKLYLLELVCHGVPSDGMLQSYINLHEKKAHARVVSLKFREKSDGWHRSSVKIRFSNGKIYKKPYVVDAHVKGLLGNITLKESCYDCQFKKGKSGSDMILGDFWGAEVEFPALDDNTGLSAVLINTIKGKRLLEKLPILIQESTVDTIVKYNRNIMFAPVPNVGRENFYLYADQYGVESAIEKLLWEKKSQKLKRELRFKLRCIAYRVTGRGHPIY